MKKLIMLLISMSTLLLFTTGCNNRLNGYTKISYVEFNQKKENGDTFPLVVGSNTCSACATYEVVMNQFIEDNQVEVFYIDLSTVSEEEYNNLRMEISFTGTPTTVFYQDGKLTSFYNRLDGAEDISGIKKYFEENNYIG